MKCSVHRSFLFSVEVRSVSPSKLNTGTVAFFFGPYMSFSDWKSPLVLPLCACSCVSAARLFPPLFFHLSSPVLDFSIDVSTFINLCGGSLV